MSLVFKHYGIILGAALLAGCVVERPAGPVSNPDPVLNSISISPATANLTVNASIQLTATLRDVNGAVLSGEVSWSSNAGAIASVSAAGLVRGNEVGSATITATSGGKTASLVVPVAAHAGYYVAPAGSASGNGSWNRPWDLASALAGASGAIHAGDTIWLRGGTYRGAFRSTLQGTAAAPIVVRQYPAERAIIDAVGTTPSSWFVAGAYTVFWGFEITNSDPNRIFTTSVGTRTNVIANYASHTRYVNMVVHDGGVGFYNESPYFDVEVVGCIWYNIGYQGTDRGHGHAIYLRSNTGPVTASDNIMFNQFGYGVHAFTNPGEGELDNIRLEGNVAFNNGTLSNNSTSSNILMGGDSYATGAVLKDNMTYSSPGVAGINVQVGYGSTVNGTVQMSGNYFAGASPVLDVGYWGSATLSGDTFIGSGSVVRLNDPATSGHAWSQETFNRDPAATAWGYAGTSYTFAGWRTATGLLAAGDALVGLPSVTRVVIRGNPYEANRANVVVYNWGNQGSVSLDLANVVQRGTAYEIRNVLDLYGAPIVSGTYDGSAVTLPIKAFAAPIPIGVTSSRAPATGTAFNVYVVTPRP